MPAVAAAARAVGIPMVKSLRRMTPLSGSQIGMARSVAMMAPDVRVTQRRHRHGPTKYAPAFRPTVEDRPAAHEIPLTVLGPPTAGRLESVFRQHFAPARWGFSDPDPGACA